MFTYLSKQTSVVTFSNIMILAAILAVGCAAMALPVSDSASSKHDLNNLMSLLGKLKDAQTLRHNVLDTSASSNRRHEKSSSIDAMLLQRAAAGVDDFDTDIEDDDDDTSSTMGKRQGAWSFDYGLGGGRFGKRGYGYAEYGLGGGRFGRDVDHVDPNHDIDVAVDSSGL